MPLYATWLEFSDRLNEHVELFTNFVAEQPVYSAAPDLSLSDACMLEGQVSRVWQFWCCYWRSCLLESCCGTTDGNGVAIQAHNSALSEDHVSSAAIRAKKNTIPYWVGANTVLRFEPTWGDTDTLATIIPRLSPANQSQLLAAVSSAHTAAKNLQKIRNCIAHTDSQSLAEIISFQTSYQSFPIKQAIDSLFWVHPKSHDYLFLEVIDELRDCAFAAIS